MKRMDKCPGTSSEKPTSRWPRVQRWQLGFDSSHCEWVSEERRERKELSYLDFFLPTGETPCLAARVFRSLAHWLLLSVGLSSEQVGWEVSMLGVWCDVILLVRKVLHSARRRMRMEEEKRMVDDVLGRWLGHACSDNDGEGGRVKRMQVKP